MKTPATLFAVVLLCAPAIAQENPWPERARIDLQAIHDRLAVDHPGPVLDPAFSDRMETGLAAAIGQAADVDDIAGYLYLLMGYVNGLPDNHLAVYGARDNPDWNVVPRDPTVYPGFITAWRDDAFVVRGAFDAAPIRDGMRLVACDGAPIEDLAASNLFAIMGKAEQPADWALYAPLLMIDQGAIAFRQPASCSFADGATTIDVALNWREVQMQSLGASLADAGTGTPPVFGARRLADGGLWVSLPSFVAELLPEATAEQIRAAIAAAQDAPYLVFDVRGNGGGNSILADSFASAAFGQDWVGGERSMDNLTMPAAYLRASDGNRAYFADARDRTSGGTRAYFDLLVTAIDTALAANEPLAQLGGGGAPLAEQGPTFEPLYGGQVFVLTDSNGFSSTLLFVDLMLRHPNARHIGWPTRAHGIYGELRQERLPSGWAYLGFSTKAFGGQAGIGMIPGELWHGEIADTPALEAWVAELAAGG